MRDATWRHGRPVIRQSRVGRRVSISLLLTLILIVKILIVTAAIKPMQKVGLAPTGGEDKDLYSDIARTIVAGHGYRVTADTAETMVRNPAYVFLRAEQMRLFGDTLLPAKLCNVLFAMGTVMLSGMLIRRYTSSLSAIAVTMLITGLYPLPLLTESRVGIESLYTFLLVLAIFLVSRAVSSRSALTFATAGAVLGLGALTRSAAMFTIPLFLLLTVWTGWKSGFLSRALGCAAALVGVAVLVVSPWVVRNYLLSGVPVFSESLVGIAAYDGWYITTTMGDGRFYQTRLDEARKRHAEIAKAAGVQFRSVPGFSDYWDMYPTINDELLYSHVLLVEVLKACRADPLLCLRHLSVNVLRFWFQGATPTLTLLLSVTQLPLLLAAAAGATLWINRGSQLLVLLVPIAVTWGISVPLVAQARYSVPLVPFLAVMVGLLIASWTGSADASDLRRLEIPLRSIGRSKSGRAILPIERCISR